MQPTAASNDSQLPCTQTSSRAHTLPQSPQWSGLVCLSTQALPHVSSPPQNDVHVPFAQNGAPDVHAIGGVPHSCGLLSGSIQDPFAPITSPGRHAHDESAQYWRSLQVVEQVPHWSTLRVVSSHPLPQFCWPAAHTHALFVQVPPVGQAALSATHTWLP